MKLIVGKDVKSLFLAEWQKYVPAILDYAKTSGKKALCSKALELDTGIATQIYSCLFYYCCI